MKNTNSMVIVPTDFQSAMAIAEVMAKSGFGSLKTKEQVFVAMQLGAGLGLTPMQAVQGIAVINGKPALYGDAMLAVVKSSGLLEYIKEDVTGTGLAMVATCTVKRKDESVPIVGRWSAEEAKTAGKWGGAGVWTQYPKRMLQMRARSFALRDAFPDLLLGLQHTVEELRDGAIINVTPLEEAAEVSPAPAVHSTTVSLYGAGGIDAKEVKRDLLYTFVEGMINSIGSHEEFYEYMDWSRTNYPIIQGVIPKGSPESDELSKLFYEKQRLYKINPTVSA